MTSEVRLVSPLGRARVIEILRREVDSTPSVGRLLATFNAAYHRGTSDVCGVVGASHFELTSRQGPGFSLRAHGVLVETNAGTEIAIMFSRPPHLAGVLGALLGRYDGDREVILGFLSKKIGAHESPERGQRDAGG